MNENIVFSIDYSKVSPNSKTSVMTFVPFTDFEGLPFPLYLSYISKLLIVLYNLLILIFGIKYKKVMFKYLRSSESKAPINDLTWFDQLNSYCLGIVILMKTFAIICPFQLSTLLGTTFCEWTGLPGCL
jgi:hypothetical protein